MGQAWQHTGSFFLGRKPPVCVWIFCLDKSATETTAKGNENALPTTITSTSFFGVILYGNLLKNIQERKRVVSSTFYIFQILDHSHFDLGSWLLALEATELS